MRSDEGRSERDKPKDWYLGDLQSQARNGRCRAGTCHCRIIPAGKGSLRWTVMTSRAQRSKGGRVDWKLHFHSTRHEERTGWLPAGGQPVARGKRQTGEQIPLDERARHLHLWERPWNIKGRGSRLQPFYWRPLACGISHLPSPNALPCSMPLPANSISDLQVAQFDSDMQGPVDSR